MTRIPRTVIYLYNVKIKGILTGQTIFNGGILLAFVLSIACAFPILSHLPWAGFIDEMAVQAVAAIQLLEVAYVILTL